MRPPLSLPGRLLARAAVAVDRAAVRAATWGTHHGTPRVGRLSHDARMAALADITRTYDEPRFLASPELFFPAAAPIDPACVRVRDLSHSGAVFDATWQSAHRPIVPEFGEKYRSHEQNLTAHARLFLGPAPRPAVIAIHGYLGGHYHLEERAFPVRWMLRRGFDVAAVVLPFHALRARTDRPTAPPFPGADPRFTIEGCRQAVEDIRGLMGYLRRRGAPAVGVMGMSLGGYITSLLSTLEPDLAFAIPIIPLASFADFARDQGQLGEGARGEAQFRAYDAAMQVVSPLARPCRVAPERTLVLAGAHDHITPRPHAERLAAHMRARLVVFPGGHILQLGRGEAFREVGRLWGALGLGEAKRA